MKANLSKQRVIACVPLERRPPSFALPIFGYPAEPSRFSIQNVNEITGCVCGFQIIADRVENIVDVKGPYVRVGDPQTFSFMVSDTEIYVGPLVALRPIFEWFVRSYPGQKGIILQISEMIGTSAERKAARLGVRSDLLEKQGTAAARSFYEGSVLQSVLWNQLLSAAIDFDMARRIIEVRGRLSAKLDANGNIKLDLSALSKEDQRAIDVSKLIESIVLEFDPLPSIPSKEAIIDNRDVHDVAKVQERVESLLSAVRRTGRQEERIALLMSAILSDPAVGKSALLQYQGDRAKTADRAIRELRRLLTENDKSWPSDDRVVAALVPWLFTQQWPMTRGDLLFYLAKHLHKWPSANKAIRNSLARTRSMYVERRRMQILDLLDLLK